MCFQKVEQNIYLCPLGHPFISGVPIDPIFSFNLSDFGFKIVLVLPVKRHPRSHNYHIGGGRGGGCAQRGQITRHSPHPLTSECYLYILN